MDLHLVASGLAIGFLTAAPIGPVNLVCIHRTLSHGRLHGFVPGLGAAAADGLFAAVAAFGLTTVSDWLSAHDFWLRLVGGLFLLVLGLRTIIAEPPRPDAARDDGRDLLHATGFTFLLTVTNPVTILGFAALFAGAGVAAETRDTASALSLVAGVFSGSGLWWLCLAVGMGFLHGRLSPAALKRINQVSGAAIVVFGVAALASLFV